VDIITISIFIVAWLTAQMSAPFLLNPGIRMIDHPRLLQIAQVAYQKKMAVIDRVWPLTNFLMSASLAGLAGKAEAAAIMQRGSI
jgi:hypothetical protein